MDKIAMYKEEIHKEAKEKVKKDYFRKNVEMNVPMYSAKGEHWNIDNDEAINLYTEQLKEDILKSPITAGILDNYNKTMAISNGIKRGNELASIPAAIMANLMIMNGLNKNPRKAMGLMLGNPAKTIAAISAPGIAIQAAGGLIGGGIAMAQNKTTRLQYLRDAKKVKALDRLTKDRIFELGREGLPKKEEK